MNIFEYKKLAKKPKKSKKKQIKKAENIKLGLKRFDIEPIGKPRMTQRDKFVKRKCTTEYWNFKDYLNKDGFCLSNKFSILFCLPFPKTYSKKKCKELFLKPHQQKPDIDNMLKAVIDSLKDDDKSICDIKARKVWSYKPAIFIINR